MGTNVKGEVTKISKELGILKYFAYSRLVPVNKMTIEKAIIIMVMIGMILVV